MNSSVFKSIKVHFFVLAFLSIVGFSTDVYACATPTAEWTGNTDSDWNNSANWNGGLPGTSDIAIIDPDNYTGAGYDPVIGSASSFSPNGVSVQNGATLTIEANLATSGNTGFVVDGEGSVVEHTGGTLNVKKNTTFKDVDISGSGRYNLSGGTVNCNRLNISDGSSRLEIDNDAVFQLSGNATIDGLLGISSSNFSGNVLNHNGGTITIADGYVFPTAFTTVNLTSGIVNYTGNNQTVGAYTYNQLNCSGTGTKIASGNLVVNGNLNITNGSVLDMADFQLDLEGNLNNYNMVADSGIRFGASPIVFSGISIQTISHTGGSQRFYDVEIDNASGVNLSCNMVLDGNLTLSTGVIITGVDTVIVTSTSASSISGYSGSSFVYGNLRRGIASNTDTYVFPIGSGTATTDYYRADLINGSLTGVTYITASVGAITEAVGNELESRLATSQGTDITQISAEAIWQINPDAAPSGGSYGLKLYTANISALVDNEFTIVKRPSGSTDYADWDAFSATTTFPDLGLLGRLVSDGYALKSGFTSFSAFGIGSSGGGALPIELISFGAEVEDEDKREIKLYWSTQSELNNDYFTIERSVDGLNFEEVIKVDGAGTSLMVKNYTALDKSPERGLSYYRLKQTDFDGKFEYFDPVAIEFGTILPSELLIYPNPALRTEQVNVKFSGLLPQEEVLVVVKDLEGRELYSKVVFTNTEGNVLEAFDPSHRLDGGTYIIIGSTKDEVYSKRLVVR